MRNNHHNHELLPGVRRRNRGMILLAVVLILIFVSSCNLPLEQQGEGAAEQVSTSVAQTIAAQPKGGESAENTQGSADTDTPVPADTATATLRPTDTPTQPPTATQTPTPEGVLIRVTGNTYCRTGPGSVFDSRGIFNTDQQSQILAKDPSGSFWYIVNPDNDAENCWIWGNYATPEGPTDQLPVFTPPPSPTPGLLFTADLYREDGVAGGVYLWFKIRNTGSMILESVTTTVKSEYTTGGGTVKKQTVTSTFNKFADKNLPVPPNLANAAPGSTVYTASDRNTTITSDKAEVTMTICSQDNLNGTCLTQSFTVDVSN